MSEEHKIAGTSPTAAAGTSASATNVGVLQRYDSLTILATLTGATGGTLDVYLQVSPDGTTWYDYIAYPQLADGAAARTYVTTVSRQGQQASIVTVGTNLTPLLAANTVIGGDFGDRMRAVYKPGAGTTVGATQTIRIFGTLRRV